jgi:hypothetical protein
MKLPKAAQALLMLLVATTVDIWAQQSTSDRQITDRIADLTARLQVSDPPASWYSELDGWTQRFVVEIDSYIQGTFRPDEGAQRLQTKLRALLAAQVLNPAYGDLPLVQLADLPSGRILLVAYTIVRGPHHDLPVVRGYRWDADRFRLVGGAAEDFTEYNMFKAVLPSPIKSELWLLTWGQAHTFNGKKVRIRIYAFDGHVVTTIWNPEDVFNADVRVTANGFVVDHYLLDQRPWREVHDEYVLTPAGPVKSN